MEDENLPRKQFGSNQQTSSEEAGKQIMGKRCVIIGGADISDYSIVRAALKTGDFAIYCDSGLKHMDLLQKPADLIVGDFDSHENPHLPVETIVLPRRKDDTDTVYAVKEAVKRGFTEFLLIGVIGARFDHSFGNIAILLYLYHLGKKALLLDDYSEMEIVAGEEAAIEDSYPYFSVLNITGCAKGITIKNAKFPLENGTIESDYQYGVSNEVLPGKTATVKVAEGEVLLVRIR